MEEGLLNQELQVSINYHNDDDDDKEGSWINDIGEGEACVCIMCVIGRKKNNSVCVNRSDDNRI